MEDSMASPQDKPIVRIAPNNHVFDLPVIVRIEERLFAQARLAETTAYTSAKSRGATA
jgi:hypothetical protein